MILTCPQCETRFLLSAAILGAEGRRVKCSSCKEIWHQDPDPEELAELSQGEEPEQPQEQEPQELSQEQLAPEPEKPEVEDIPEGVKPKAEAESTPEGSAEGPGARRRMIGGFALAGCVFVLIFIGLYFSHKSVIASWPASEAFYGMLGFDADIPGEGLVFDRVTVTSEKEGELEKIKLEGYIINLTSHDQRIPMIEVSLIGEHASVLKKIVMPAPEEKLKAEETAPFSSVLEFKEGQAESVYMRFILKAAKDADMIALQKADAHEDAHDAAKPEHVAPEHHEEKTHP